MLPTLNHEIFNFGVLMAKLSIIDNSMMMISGILIQDGKILSFELGALLFPFESQMNGFEIILQLDFPLQVT